MRHGDNVCARREPDCGRSARNSGETHVDAATPTKFVVSPCSILPAAFMENLASTPKILKRNQICRNQIHVVLDFFLPPKSTLTSKIAIANILSGSTLSRGALSRWRLPRAKNEDTRSFRIFDVAFALEGQARGESCEKIRVGFDERSRPSKEFVDQSDSDC